MTCKKLISRKTNQSLCISMCWPVHLCNWRTSILSVIIASIPDDWKSLSFSISTHFYHKIIIKEFIFSSSFEQAQAPLTGFVHSFLSEWCAWHNVCSIHSCYLDKYWRGESKFFSVPSSSHKILCFILFSVFFYTRFSVSKSLEVVFCKHWLLSAGTVKFYI